LYQKKLKKKVVAKPKNPLFVPRPKNFRIGGDLRAKVDLTRFVKFPKNVRLQRQRRILLQRLKVPPSINQFSKTLDRNQAIELFKLLSKYRPETKSAKQHRLKDLALKQKDSTGPVTIPPPGPVIKFGLGHVTHLIEEKKAKLVIIAHDVNPIELVVWLPALCKKMNISYCIVKGRSRLGALIHQKNASCLCLTDVNKEDKNLFETLINNYHSQFNDNIDVIKRWGGGIMGLKTQAKLIKRQKAIDIEKAKKAKF